MAAADYVSAVQQLYVAYFGRPADVSGLANFTAALDATGVPATIEGVKQAYGTNATVKTLVDQFGTSAESANLYGSGTVESFVFAIYQNVLDRVPDADGFKFWVDEINAGRVARAKAALDIMAGAKANTSAQGLIDAATVDAKIAVATNFTTAVTTQNATYSGDAAAATARAMLADVNNTTDVTAFQATITSTLTTITNPDAGSTFTLTTSATADTLIGTAKNDTFTGDKATFVVADKIIDQSTTDVDTFNLTFNDDVGAMSTTNVEKINITIDNTLAKTVDAANMSGVQNLTVTRADVVVGGATIAGNKNVRVNNVDSSKVAAVTAGTGTKDFRVDQATKAGATINGDAASGAVTVVGAATVNAAAATGVTIDGLGSATEDAKAIVVNAAKATTINVGTTTATTGAVTVTAAAATTVNVGNNDAGAEGGVTITAAKAKTISVQGIDDSGVTIAGGTFAKADAAKFTLEGVANTTTDVATISAGGVVTLDVDGDGAGGSAVDTLNLSGNGAEVTYTVEGAFSKIAASGADAVNVTTTAALLTTKTVTGVKTLSISTKAGAATDLSKVSATTIEYGVSLDGDAVTVAADASILVSKDQGTEVELIAKTDKSNVTITVGDDTDSDAQATIDFNAIKLDAANDFATVNIVANAGRLNATSLDAGANTTVVITGTQNVTLGTLGDAKAINAAGLTGILSVTTSATAKTVTAGAGADIITAAGAAVLTIDAGDGDNDVTVQNAAADASAFVTGAGSDTVNVDNDNAIVVSTGAGNDTVIVTAQAGSSKGVFVGGEGSDTLTIDANNNSSGESTFAFSGFETISLSGANIAFEVSNDQFNGQTIALKGDAGDSFTVTAAAATTAATINATNLTVASGSVVAINLEGSAKGDTITGGKAAESINGGLGADTIDGGAGTDTLAYDDLAVGVAKDTTEATAGTISGVVINMGSTALTGAGVLGKAALYISGGLTSVASGTSAYLFAADSTKNSAVVDTFTNIENATGSDGVDYIVGNTSANVITGGKGNDVLTGGDGADTFVVSGVTALTNGSDTITDFVVADDTVQFSLTAVNTAAGSALVAGAIAAGNFVSGAGAAAADADDYFLYDTGTGALSFDADGNGAGAAVVLVTLTGAPAITVADIVLA